MNLLTVTDTPIVDQNAVMKYVKDTCKEHEWNIECLCFDPANAAKLMMDLSDEGYEVEEVYQSHKSLNESTQDLGTGLQWQYYLHLQSVIEFCNEQCSNPEESGTDQD